MVFLTLICSSGLRPLGPGACRGITWTGGRAAVEILAFKAPLKPTGSANRPLTYLHPSCKVARTEWCPVQLSLLRPTPLDTRMWDPEQMPLAALMPRL